MYQYHPRTDGRRTDTAGGGHLQCSGRSGLVVVRGMSRSRATLIWSEKGGRGRRQRQIHRIFRSSYSLRQPSRCDHFFSLSMVIPPNPHDTKGKGCSLHHKDGRAALYQLPSPKWRRIVHVQLAAAAEQTRRESGSLARVAKSTTTIVIIIMTIVVVLSGLPSNGRSKFGRRRIGGREMAQCITEVQTSAAVVGAALELGGGMDG